MRDTFEIILIVLLGLTCLDLLAWAGLILYNAIKNKHNSFNDLR